MKKHLFAVYDVKAEEYLPIWTFPAEAAAVRMFVDLLGNRELPPGQHPEDYELHALGVFQSAGECPSTSSRVVGSPTRLVLSGQTWKASLATGPALEREA